MKFLHREPHTITQILGVGWTTKRRKIDSTIDSIYHKFATNPIVKEYVDDYLNPERHWLKWRDSLFDYCDTYNKVPLHKTKYNNTNIGSWLSNQKKKINATADSTYQKLTMNPLVQKCLDTYLIKKQKRMSHATSYHTCSSHKYTIASMW